MVTEPVSSLPLAVVAIGDWTETVRVIGSVPVLVSLSSVTAVLFWVMNFVSAMLRLALVNAPVKYLGRWSRDAVVSVTVWPGIVTVYRLWLAPVGRSRYA